MLAKTGVLDIRPGMFSHFYLTFSAFQINARKAIFGHPLGVALVEVFVTSLVSLPLVFIEIYIMLIILIQVS